MLKSTFGEIAMKSRQRQKDILFSLIVFFSAFAVNLLIQKLFTTQTLVPMIFVFGVFLISLKTHGYDYAREYTKIFFKEYREAFGRDYV